MNWEVRRALRWGSQLMTLSPTRQSAEAFAKEDIEQNGSVGRIELVDEKTRTVYYDIHEEMT